MNLSNSFEQQVAIVTGAGQGIGFEISGKWSYCSVKRY